VLLPHPEHIEILRRGPKAWNAWREQHHSVVPNLVGIGLKLSERQMGPINGGPINLRYAQLGGACLRFATLSKANLEAADLSDADLTYAWLDHADLTYANLSNALLDHADLAGAKLMKANLSGANLQHARNLTQRQLYGSIGNALTILPPQLQRPQSWSERTSQVRSENLPVRDTAHEPGSTHKKLTRKAETLLYFSGVIIAGFLWLLGTQAARQDTGHFRGARPDLTEMKRGLLDASAP
jgi:uncharacterized protein YjbI with pentapeptide repeats